MEQVSLGALSDSVGSVTERDEFELRKQVVKLIMPMFKLANIAVLVLVFVCLAVDVAMGVIDVAHAPLVTREVLMALIGATTIQLGTLALGIGKFLFPDKQSSS